MAKSVFISSTSLDLENHRSAVNSVIRRLKLRPIDMEDFGSQPGGASGVSLREVRSADIFIGIIAHRYGYVPEGMTKSVTEQEYDEAVRRGIPRLMYLVKPDYYWEWDGKTENQEDDLARQRLAVFKARVNQKEVRSLFMTPDQLAAQVSTDLSKLLTQMDPRMLRFLIAVSVICVLAVGMYLFSTTSTGHFLIHWLFPAGTSFMEDEVGVVLADFGDESVEYGIERGFTEAGVKFIRVHHPLTDQTEAQQVSKLYNATIVIYGQTLDGVAKGVNLQFEIAPHQKQYVGTSVGGLLITADLPSFNSIILKGTDALYVVDFIQGQIAYSKNDYDKALEFFNQAEAYIPTGRETEAKVNALYVYRGITYYNQKNYERALADYNQALTLDPEYAITYNNRGAVYLNQKNYERALADFNQTLTLDPEFAYAYSNRGIIYYDQKDYERALADFNQALTLNPYLAEAYNGRGFVYYTQKDYERALVDYNQALSLDPENAYAYNNRGLVYHDQKDYERALADYNQALSLDPELATFYYNRGFVYYTQKDYERALADFNQALTLDPEFAYAYSNRGLVYYTQKDYERALADYNQALSRDPELAVAYNNRGRVYYTQKDYERALADYNQTLFLDPKFAEAYINRGNIYGIKGQYDLSISDSTHALELDPATEAKAAAIVNRGQAYYFLHEYDKALADYQTYKQLIGHLEPFMEEQISRMNANLEPDGVWNWPYT